VYLIARPSSLSQAASFLLTADGFDDELVVISPSTVAPAVGYPRLIRIVAGPNGWVLPGPTQGLPLALPFNL